MPSLGHLGWLCGDCNMQHVMVPMVGYHNRSASCHVPYTCHSLGIITCLCGCHLTTCTCAACVMVLLQGTAEYMSPEVLKGKHPSNGTGIGLGWVLRHAMLQPDQTSAVLCRFLVPDCVYSFKPSTVACRPPFKCQLKRP